MNIFTNKIIFKQLSSCNSDYLEIFSAKVCKPVNLNNKLSMLPFLLLP